MTKGSCPTTETALK